MSASAFDLYGKHSLTVAMCANAAIRLHQKAWDELVMMYGPTYPKTLLLIDLANMVRDERHASWVDLGGP